MKVLLVCVFEMSTSILLKNLRKLVAEKGLQIEVDTAPVAVLGRDLLSRYDVILLAPHVRYLKDDVIRKLGDLKKPVHVLDMTSYGRADANAVLALIGKAEERGT